MSDSKFPCPICGHSSTMLDVVDFNKSCEEQHGRVLPRSGIPIYYNLCDFCEFCFAPEFQSWTVDDFTNKIYNEDYILVDPDYQSARPTNNAMVLNRLFNSNKHLIRHLDYGGGNGLLSQTLTQEGWDSTSYDPFVDTSIDPKLLNKFNFITAFEVFEHVQAIDLLMNNMISIFDEGGIILFSTLLNDDFIRPNSRINWWYASPRNGHISLYSRKSLEHLAGRFGLKYRELSNGLHVFMKEIPEWARLLFDPPPDRPAEVAPSKTPARPNPTQSFAPFVEQAMTRYGPMLFPIRDKYVGRSLKEYGQFCHGEFDLFIHFISTGAIVLDIGANIGAHTIPLAQLVGSTGVVVAFEPQPVLHQILSANLLLNGIPNVLTYAMALGDTEGEGLMPILDYSLPENFGGIGLDMVGEGTPVPIGKLDDFHLERVDFIKLDVEGFESKVLGGAVETIQRCRPIMYIENDRSEKSAELIQRLFDMGYRLWWHTPPLFSPDNFNGNPVNVFPNIVSINMLAIHREMRPIEGLKEVLSPHDTWK